MSRSWSRGKGRDLCLETKTLRSRPRPDSAARLWKTYIYCYIQKQNVHCLTCAVFSSSMQSWLHMDWMPANSDMTMVVVHKSASV